MNLRAWVPAVVSLGLFGAAFAWWPHVPHPAMPFRPLGPTALSLVLGLSAAWLVRRDPDGPGVVWAAHAAALVVALSVLWLFRDVPLNYGGERGGLTLTAMVTTFRHDWRNQDFFYAELHSFYPFAYHYILGRLAALFDVAGYVAVRAGSLVLAYVLPLALFAAWRRLAAPATALLASQATVLVLLPELLIRKPHEALSVALVVPWFLAVAAGPPASTRARRWWWLGLGGAAGLLAMTFYYWFFAVGLWLAVQTAVAARRRGGAARRLLHTWGPVLGVALVVAAPFWGPLMIDLVRFGADPRQSNHYVAGDLALWLLEARSGQASIALPLGLLWLGGVATLLVCRPHDVLPRALGSLTFAALGWVLLGKLGFFVGVSLLDFKMVELLAVSLAAAGALGLATIAARQPASRPLLLAGAVGGLALLQGRVLAELPQLPLYRQTVNDEVRHDLLDPAFQRAATGRVVLTSDPALANYVPSHSFIAPRAILSHPAGRFDERLSFLRELGRLGDRPQFVAWMLRHNAYGPIDALYLPGRKVLTVHDDTFPDFPPSRAIRIDLRELPLPSPFFRGAPQHRGWFEVASVPPPPRLGPAERRLIEQHGNEQAKARLAAGGDGAPSRPRSGRGGRP